MAACAADHGAARAVRFALLALLAVAGSLTGARAQEPATLPAGGIDVYFRDFSYNGATGRTEVTEPSISQGDLSLEAAKGEFQTQRDDGVTQWRLEGEVEIRSPGVRVTGDAADFVARNDLLERFELHGSPARFEDLAPGSAEEVFGEAEQLVYDAVAGVVSLNGEARVVIGANEYLGCDLIYDIVAQASRSGSSECERPMQMIRIAPSEDAAGRQAP